MKADTKTAATPESFQIIRDIIIFKASHTTIVFSI